MSRHKILASHILDSIESISRYTNGVTKTEFLSNFMLQDAVVRQLEIIGEAIRNIDPTVRDKFPDVPWRDIIAMRNLLIREYFRTDAETVWNVMQIDLQPLKGQLIKIRDYDIQ